MYTRLTPLETNVKDVLKEKYLFPIEVVPDIEDQIEKMSFTI